MAMPRYFRGITVKDGEIKHRDGRGPLAGARATVDSGGGIDRRLSMTRLVFTGGLGLFWKKKVDYRETYLLVEGDGFAFVIKVPQKQNRQARKFAAWITSEGSKLAKIAPSQPGLPAAPAPAAAPSPDEPFVWPTLGQLWRGEFDPSSLQQPSPVESGPAEALGSIDPAPSVADEVAKFGALRDAGLITDHEFELQKSRLLGTPPPQQQLSPTPPPFRALASGADIEDAVVVADSAAAASAPGSPTPSDSVLESQDHTWSNSAGWHPDPRGLHQYRYWDGRAWTDEVLDPDQSNHPPAHAVEQRLTEPDPNPQVDAAATESVSQPGWFPDPYRSHEHRYWDGARWTEHVSTAGNNSISPPPR